MLPAQRQLYNHPDSAGPITLHTADDFEGMRAAGRLAAEALDMITEFVVEGVSTAALDKRIQDFVEGAGAVSATIGYRGYQHASCISLNEVVCHGIPSDSTTLEDNHRYYTMSVYQNNEANSFTDNFINMENAEVKEGEFISYLMQQ